ncbi:MAG: hypothetical protein Q9217_003290 [Psora testacea]
MAEFSGLLDAFVVWLGEKAIVIGVLFHWETIFQSVEGDVLRTLALLIPPRTLKRSPEFQNPMPPVKRQCIELVAFWKHNDSSGSEIGERKTALQVDDKCVRALQQMNQDKIWFDPTCRPQYRYGVNPTATALRQSLSGINLPYTLMETTPSRPPVARQRSHVPGGYDTDDDLSPIKASFSDAQLGRPESPGKLAGSPTREGNGPHNAPPDEGGSLLVGDNDTFLQEKEMRQRLEDLDSTFLQQVSPVVRAPASERGGDLSELVDSSSLSDATTALQRPTDDKDANCSQGAGIKQDARPESPATPSDVYHTPASGRTEHLSPEPKQRPYTQHHHNTPALQTISSPLTAATAAGTVSREVSMTPASDETANESGGGILHDQQTTPKKHRVQSSTPRAGSPTPTKPSAAPAAKSQADAETFSEPELGSRRPPGRPGHPNGPMVSARSSYSSRTTTSTEGGSDVTVGADYALQSGGAIPQHGSITSRPTDFSRSISLGSMASSVSCISDSEDRIKVVDGGLYTLNENADNRGPRTPPTSSGNLATPTDTVVVQRVRDIEVPATLARDYANGRRQSSTPKGNAVPTPSAVRSANNMTLKEQSSTIDRLMKENWNLKLKITFLDEALNRKSDESIKAMISENVDLRTAKFQAAKETRELKRTTRDLERRLKETSDELARKASAPPPEEINARRDDEAYVELEEEVMYLRERVTTYDVEMEKVRNEKFVQETEKKKLAQVVERMNETDKGTDIGAREEVDLWKDLLAAETARLEQADEDNRRLRDEIRRLKSDASSTTTSNYATNVYNGNRRQKLSSTVSYNNDSDRAIDATGASSGVSSTLVERLRHENTELRREVGAQTSMLTSRNRERERLQHEIEDLKLGSRSGHETRSIAGDSILERSASRAHGRPGSRASDQTRNTQMSDPEREAFEFKNGQLRDQNAKLRLEIQSLAGQTDQLLDELEQLDSLKLNYEELQQTYGTNLEALQIMQRERDDALQAHENMRDVLQELEAEGRERIGALEEELDQRNNEYEHLQNQLCNHAENAEALRREVRTLSESILRIEEEMEAKNKRVRDLQLELEELGHEADAMDKDLRDEKDKNAKLLVQHESSQGEVAFLREEQEGDKIKIGDLEDALKNLQASLTSEKARTEDLETRIVDERHQREAIDSKEKQEVQKMINELNREASIAKDESRNLKRDLQSRDIELTSFKERLTELENQLREVLGDPNGTRSTFLSSITKLQRELQATSIELETTQNNLSEKDRLLKSRDALLESHGLESKKLSELLERERQARRADKVHHEQWQRTHQHTSRTVSQKDVRITELESSRQADRKKISTIEAQYKDQLFERNTLLLTLWNRISTICGPDWQHHNSLIQNHLPTVDVVANSSMYALFSKNLLAAVKTLESVVIGFQSRIKTIERELRTEYQSLESTLDGRIKKLDKLEAIVQSHRISGTFTAAPEIAKLRGENRLLKSELATLQKQEMHARNASRVGSQLDSPTQSGAREVPAPPPTLARHHSSSAVEHLSNAQNSPSSPGRRSSRPSTLDHNIQSQPIEPSQQRFIHRLKELERRLKAEREARLLDRSGARKRLEEGAEENRRLKGELERERSRRGGGPGSNQTAT